MTGEADQPSGHGRDWRRLARYLAAGTIVVVIAVLFVVQEMGGSSGSGDEPGLLDDAVVEIDQPAPDFELRSLDGGTVRLSEFRGQTVVLNFWATWCPPCRTEMPEFDAAYREHQAAGGGLVVLAVDDLATDSESEVRDFIDELGVAFPVLFDTSTSEVAKRYGVVGRPSTFFIDPDGTLRARNVGPLTADTLRDRLAAMESDGGG